MTLQEVLNKHNRHALAFHAEGGSDETQDTPSPPVAKLDREGFRRDLEVARQRTESDFRDCKRMLVWPFLLSITFLIILVAVAVLALLRPDAMQAYKIFGAVMAIVSSALSGLGLLKANDQVSYMQRLWREKEATEMLLSLAVNLNDDAAIERIIFLMQKRLESALVSS